MFSESGFLVSKEHINSDIILSCCRDLIKIQSNKKYIKEGIKLIDLYKNKPDRFIGIEKKTIGKKELFIVSNPAQDYHSFKHLLTLKSIWELVAQCLLIEVDKVRFDMLNITRKPAKIGPSLGWHRDYCNKYISSEDSKDMLRVLIPLQSFHESSGCTKILHGSNNVSDSSIREGLKPDKYLCEKSAFELELMLGDLAILDSKVIHGGKRNTSPYDRDLIVIQFSKASCKRMFNQENKELFFNFSRYDILAKNNLSGL